MKQFYLFILLIGSLNCISQNQNHDLFQTWYLRFVQSNDLATPYTVSAITPVISPTLTITDDLNFAGNGACNSFGGTITESAPGEIQITGFFATLLICNSEIHNSFEQSYFGFMQSAQFYTIGSERDGLVLTINNPLMGQAVFQNRPLKTKDFQSDLVALYPNPSSDKVFLDATQLTISKIQVVNTTGQTVKTIKNNFGVVEVSDLPSGIYMLKIDTENGTVTKKIVRE